MRLAISSLKHNETSIKTFHDTIHVIFQRIHQRIVMLAYKRDEMISVTDLLKGFKTTLDKLTSHQLDKVAVMKNNKPEAVILSIDEYERLQVKHHWNRLDEASYLLSAFESLADAESKSLSLEELDAKLDQTIKRYEH